MVEDVISECRGTMGAGVEALKQGLAKVRTGRANTALLDGIRVDYYGSMTPLNQVAGVQVADPRLIVIKPWEKRIIADIEKAIKASDLGINPQSDGEIIRLPIPALTEERRKDLLKTVRVKAEEAKVAIRNARRDANEMLKELLKESEITEDDSTRALKRVQDETDAHTKLVDDVVAKKEKEIMEV
ncbi:MAG: ribosome recycling factor [Deltaproteobacteria bacterium]|nr:ribosome recycling factor [Deltaproteobacteria bacterium]